MHYGNVGKFLQEFLLERKIVGIVDNIKEEGTPKKV